MIKEEVGIASSEFIRLRGWRNTDDFSVTNTVSTIQLVANSSNSSTGATNSSTGASRISGGRLASSSSTGSNGSINSSAGMTSNSVSRGRRGSCVGIIYS